MKADFTTKFLLALIAALLAIIAARPLVEPEPARAATADPAIWIEPGTTNLRAPDSSRNVIGKVIVDLNNGNVWGFPTLTNAPYPMDTTSTSPPVSHPIFLGRYQFDRMRRGSE